MPGKPVLPVQEYCDDSQVITFGPIAAADFPVAGTMALWFPDRPVVIDHVSMYQVGGTTMSAGVLQLLRGVGALGDTGADANIAAVLTAARTIATGTCPTALDTRVAFAITDTDGFGNNDENHLNGTPHESTPGAGDSVVDFVAVDETTPTVAGTHLYIEIRYRSKIN